jgi:hypothetical protein
MSKSDSTGTYHVLLSSCSTSISGKKWRVVSREMKNVSNSEDARGIASKWEVESQPLPYLLTGSNFKRFVNVWTKIEYQRNH